jgi:uncharacterized coiled-coil protein SlyX
MTERIGAVNVRDDGTISIGTTDDDWITVEPNAEAKIIMQMQERLATQRDTIEQLRQALARSERMVRQQAKRIEQLERTVYELEGDV